MYGYIQLFITIDKLPTPPQMTQKFVLLKGLAFEYSYLPSLLATGRALVVRSDCRQLSKIVKICEKIQFSHFPNITLFYENWKHMIVGHLMYKLHGKFYLKMFQHSMVNDFFWIPVVQEIQT